MTSRHQAMAEVGSRLMVSTQKTVPAARARSSRARAPVMLGVSTAAKRVTAVIIQTKPIVIVGDGHPLAPPPRFGEGAGGRGYAGASPTSPRPRIHAPPSPKPGGGRMRDGVSGVGAAV